MSSLKGLFVIFVSMVVFQSGSASAQNDSASKLPVITLEQDYNGVDVTSGSYVTKSPFHLASPAASKLGANTYFNGRSFGFSLNTYISDETYSTYGSNATIRELKLVFEGRSFFFRCTGVGDCADLNYQKDGSKLVRLAVRQLSPVSGEDRYKFTYRDGTSVNFFDPVYHAVNPCTSDDSGCNAAIYSAYAYASSIKYPTGEKLTFDPLTTQGYDNDGVYRVSTNIKSNLGYTLRFATKMPTNYVAPTKAGVFWQRQILADDVDIRMVLREANADIVGVQGKRIYESLQIGGQSLKTFQLIDSIGRTSSWGFTTKLAVGCSYPDLDIRQTMVTKETSPGNIVTDIEYHTAVNQALDMWQVKSVKRGGRTWNYTYNESGRQGVTVTDAYNGKRTSLPSVWSNPLAQPSGCPPLIPAKPTKYTDELNRVTDVRLDTNSNEIAEISYPGGGGYIYHRDARSNILTVSEKPTTGGTPVVIYEANYASSCLNAFTCNQPNWIEDANNNRTNLTYYDNHGGIKSKTLPPNREGVYAREFYFYEALDTGDGTIYRLARVETCGLVAAELSATSCPMSANTKVQLKTYWNKTFLPESVTVKDGVDGSSQTTTYTYNALGLVTSTDGPREDVDDVSYRTYDVVGRLIFEILPHPGGSCQDTGQGCRVRQMIKHYYNNDDQETRIEIGSGNSTDGSDFVWSSAKIMTYDNSGLLIKIEEVAP